MTDSDTLLRVENLQTQFKLKHGSLRAVDGLSFTLARGKTLCIVGESGSGKTVSSLSVMRLIDPPGKVTGGRIVFKGQDLLTLSKKQMEAVRGDQIAMVFQDPMTSLNPSFRIGPQIAEGMMLHRSLSQEAAKAKAIEIMRRVGIPDSQARYNDFPHQFSGGMRQRVLIAGAIACDPDLLIADEPTTALDVTIQAQILKLLKQIQKSLGSALILVTHDLGVVAAMADEVMVMYAGKMVERGPVDQIFDSPQHPYTQGLLRSVVRLEDSPNDALRPIPGLPPDLASLPLGCSFHPRCPVAQDICKKQFPTLRESAEGQIVACHLVEGKTLEQLSG